MILPLHMCRKGVIASGYAKTKEVDIAQELGAGKYIKKPYVLEIIGLAVKKKWRNRQFLASISIDVYLIIGKLSPTSK